MLSGEGQRVVERRTDQGRSFLTYIMPRLAGDAEEKETTLVMILAAMQAKYADGLNDAARAAEQLAAARPSAQEAAVIARALREIERRAREDQVTSL